MKYIFVTGGVVSGLGKGITAASLGRLLKARGIKVTMQKIDPYLNVDPGTMNPLQHGEVFVTDDGAETDLDLGHYERFIDESLTRNASVSSGSIYSAVLDKERHGDYNGGTVQVIPHVTDEIKERIRAGKDGYDVAIIEIGGTVGDIEGLPILEATRQFATEVGRDDCLFIHVTLVPYLESSGEAKSKPTQRSVKDLLSLGIQPDIVVCRTDVPLEEELKQKIALFCNVPIAHVIENGNRPLLYDVVFSMQREELDKVVLNRLRMEDSVPDLADWQHMVWSLLHPEKTVKIAIVGKYASLRDSYLSVIEALKHGGIESKTDVRLIWIDAETLDDESAPAHLAGCHGILVPGGFGIRGVEGKVAATRYARENNIPFLGLCLGMHVAVIEFARQVAGMTDAHSTEFDTGTTHPVIDLMADQTDIERLGGTMRLGSYPCSLNEKSKAFSLYGKADIDERHRHRYEFNNAFRDVLAEHGLLIAGTSPDGHIVEAVEIPEHRWFVGCQFHPEFKSRPNRPHPLFRGFVSAARAFLEEK
ncbi:MAG TPA: CTP synthase [Clostridiaceae bacterium]|nr:CTP synthase [Clostridiaceae bacterium]